MGAAHASPARQRCTNAAVGISVPASATTCATRAAGKNTLVMMLATVFARGKTRFGFRPLAADFIL